MVVRGVDDDLRTGSDGRTELRRRPIRGLKRPLPFPNNDWQIGQIFTYTSCVCDVAQPSLVVFLGRKKTEKLMIIVESHLKEKSQWLTSNSKNQVCAHRAKPYPPLLQPAPSSPGQIT